MNQYEAEKQASQQAHERAAQKTKDMALQFEADLSAVMSEPAGRRFVARLIATFGIRKASFTQDPSGRSDAFNEGRRDAGIKLEEQVQRICPKQWRLMMTEHDDAIAREYAATPTPANQLP